LARLASREKIMIDLNSENLRRRANRGYAQEASRREDNRGVTNGEQTRNIAALALKRGPTVDFSSYWQRQIQMA
jgi:hypothetical protein